MQKGFCKIEITHPLVKQLCELSGQFETTISYKNLEIDFGIGFTKSSPAWSRILVHTKSEREDRYGEELEYYENYIKIKRIYTNTEYEGSILNELLKEEEFIWLLEEELLKLI